LETLKYFLQRTFKIRTEGNPVVTNLSWLHRDHISLSVETQYVDGLRIFYISQV